MSSPTVMTRARARVRAWKRRADPTPVVVEMAALDPSDRVLDVGCGSGTALRSAASITPTVAGVEPDPVLAQTTRVRVPIADVREADAAHLPFESHRFSVAWTFHSIHHWPDVDAGLAETARVVQPGGRVLIGDRLLRSAGHDHGLALEAFDRIADRVSALGFERSRFHVRSHGRLELGVLIAEKQPAAGDGRENLHSGFPDLII